ncbi:MAG: hypothetical protein R3E68_04695 [Burkholderiaceae bacterium]
MSDPSDAGPAPARPADGVVTTPEPVRRARRPVLLGVPWVPVLLRLAVPAVLASLIQGTLLFIEARELARVGTEALAGVAVVFPLLMLTQMPRPARHRRAQAGDRPGDGCRRSRPRPGAWLERLLVAGPGRRGADSACRAAGRPWFYAWLGARDAVLAAATTYSAALFAGIVLLVLSST